MDQVWRSVGLWLAMKGVLLLGLVLCCLGSAHAISPQDEAKRTFRECADCPEMVAVPAGKFVMGSPFSEHGRFDSEGPQHVVAVRAFAIGKTDVTSDEFLKFLRETGYQPAACDPLLRLSWHSLGHGVAYTPGTSDPPLWPATCLNWKDAEAYIAWLNAKVRDLPSVGRRRNGPYRLPTEAEWEYAARAGSRTARWWGEAIGTGQANCDGCGSAWDGRLLAPVDSFGPNAFGLYDVLGNVWQWVSDCWNGSYIGAPQDGSNWDRGDCSKHVLRGGSWSNVPIFVRSAARIGVDAGGRDFDWSNYAGFRVARTLP